MRKMLCVDDDFQKVIVLQVLDGPARIKRKSARRPSEAHKSEDARPDEMLNRLHGNRPPQRRSLVDLLPALLIYWLGAGGRMPGHLRFMEHSHMHRDLLCPFDTRLGSAIDDEQFYSAVRFRARDDIEL